MNHGLPPGMLELAKSQQSRQFSASTVNMLAKRSTNDRHLALTVNPQYTNAMSGSRNVLTNDNNIDVTSNDQNDNDAMFIKMQQGHEQKDDEKEQEEHQE